jgi:hypothetical protein
VCRGTFTVILLIIIISRGAKIPGARWSGRKNFVRWWAEYLWALSVDLASCHANGVQNF